MEKTFPKKRFGQHFLKSEPAIDQIIGHAVLRETDTVVEIGPGMGALTENLANNVDKLVLIEMDRELVNLLKNKFEKEIKEGRIEIIEGDAISFDFSKIKAPRFKVVSNLPYNVGIPILFNLYSFKERIELMTLMFQKEVAEKITAVPGTRKFGPLAINCQRHAEIYKVIDLKPADFYPQPQVDSQVLNFIFYEKQKIEIVDEDLFQVLVKALFFRKRKKAVNSLELSQAFPYIDIKKMFRSLGIDEAKRPEDLDFDELQKICSFIYPKYEEQQ